MGEKHALVIGSSDYQDTSLAQLTAPGQDALALARVLKAQEIGAFDSVTQLLNEAENGIRRAIARFFAGKTRDDLLLLYFSGHGVRDEQGHLFLAAADTDRALLSATAIPAAFITDQMNRCLSRRQVLILDCCNSGAFAAGTKGATGASMGTATAFEGTGYGRVVLTATDATQFAWEGNRILGEASKSLFTHFLVQGLETGEADADADGKISLDEWYSYVYEQVVLHTSGQTPGKWSYRQQGDIVIAANPRSRPLQFFALPLELRQLIESPIAGARVAAVGELKAMLTSTLPGLAEAAAEALRKLCGDANRQVERAASEALQIHVDQPARSADASADPRPVERPTPTAPFEPALPDPAAEPQPGPTPPSALPEPSSPAPATAELPPGLELVRLPDFGSEITNVTLTRQVKQVGQSVERGEVVAEVETDKVNLEIEAPSDGVVKSWALEEGQTASVGTLMLVIGPPDVVVDAELLEKLKRSAQTAWEPAPASAIPAAHPSHPGLVHMPQLGPDIKHGTLTRQAKKLGQPISKGEVLCEVETDKAIVEIDAPVDGEIRAWLFDEGAQVPVGALVVVIGAPGEQFDLNALRQQAQAPKV